MFAAPRRTFSTLRSFALSLVVGSVAVLAACSSDNNDNPAGPVCDSSKCAAGNTCIEFNGETKCRRTCSSNTDPATSCPFGYTCSDPETGVGAFCMQSTAVRDDGSPLVKKPSGQWGSKCQANLGIENPGCDTEQGFYCLASSPTDGDAYCTRYGCAQDLDCGPGFWCGKVNDTPNAVTAKKKFGNAPLDVCLKRTYCSTCKVDLDCPTIQGTAQHCVEDGSGARVCVPECDSDQACSNEAKCVPFGDTKVCYPRADVCVGDGSLCSPCRVDTDCGEDGICIKGQYTTEKSCAKKTAACTSCPKTLDSTGGAVGCTKEDDKQNYCVGLYKLGKPVNGQQPYDLGCYTPARK
jgi:hypothetical protein